MQQRQKCCSQCPGTWTSGTAEFPTDHVCCLPTYVRGNLKLSSLSKMNPGEDEKSEKLREKVSNSKYENERPSSCYNRFRIAKKFHAENLQHQALPDRVDDSIFKNVKTTKNGEISCRESEKRNICKYSRPSRYSQKIHTGLQYGPTLGCKTPMTNMDLAICWEAPFDPTYEAPRRKHIDGTNGGPAPAIFALVEHEIVHEKNLRKAGKCLRHPVEIYEAKFSNLRNCCRCMLDQLSDPKDLKVNDRLSDDSKNPNEACERCSEEIPEKVKDEKKHSACSDKHLCDDLESLRITDKRHATLPRSTTSKREKLQPLHLRNCSSCQCRGDPAARKPRQRLIQSAHVGLRNIRRNGLPTKISVPRPRTPYAKRSFCIDTLTPPFSIINGCRDADYPEHWRLTSVYQQSYRNPLKQRGTILNWH